MLGQTQSPDLLRTKTRPLERIGQEKNKKQSQTQWIPSYCGLQCWGIGCRCSSIKQQSKAAPTPTHVNINAAMHWKLDVGTGLEMPIVNFQLTRLTLHQNNTLSRRAAWCQLSLSTCSVNSSIRFRPEWVLVLVGASQWARLEVLDRT